MARRLICLGTLLLLCDAGTDARQTGQRRSSGFEIQEATIETLQQAILKKQITTQGIVEAYLKRIQAYNGTCVNEPQGILGPVTPIAHARQINALSTLNLRPGARAKWGFDARKARSLTDKADDAANMPDALETAAAQDRQYARTGRLAGPLHGVVLAIKDQYDTFDMRTTSGADADYANDRPPDDATFVKRLRDAGAIILAKANLAEYAVDGARSSFGGTFCNPYDTEREPGMSSSGSATAVAANLVTCGIGEETVVSIRWPASVNSLVGLAPTQELVSRDGMIGSGLVMRVGPMCRTVQDTARVFDAFAGYDPKDELTVFSVGRTPPKGYTSFVGVRRLDGVRIGVLREYMRRSLLAKADEESIGLVEKAIADVRALGATIVDPGPEGELFTQCIARYAPELLNSAFARQYPQLFPSSGPAPAPAAPAAPAAGAQIPALLQLQADPARVPAALSLRTLNAGGFGPAGEGKYMIDRYLRERGDANIKSNADLITKARFYQDPNFPDRKQAREQAERATVLDTSGRLHGRFAVQTMLLQCMQEQRLDALVSPMSTVPPRKLTSPREPAVNGRTPIGYSLIGQQGFPVITVPAGFTATVWDRVADASGPRLVGPVSAALPVGVDFIARPFDEPLLFRIASAYEAATKHRKPPADFGPLPASQPAQGRSTAAAGNCDRECLRGFITRYLEAMVAHTPGALPVAANVRFTEDTVDLKLGEGLWKGASKIRPYRLDILDPAQGVAASQVVVEEAGSPVMLMLRLKVVNRAITEVETQVTRNQKEGAIFAIEDLRLPNAAMIAPVPSSKRSSRAEAIRLAEYYPAGLEIGSFVSVNAPFASDAYRFENGRLMAGKGCTFSPPSCEDIKGAKISTHPGLSYRVAAVDEELGITLLRINFGRADRYGVGNALMVWEAFKVYGGEIHAVEAFMKIMPADAGSGWDTDVRRPVR